jgi:prolyl-tRNA synthetase family II
VLLRMSNLFLRTLREDPADAEVPSHKLLVRGGYVRRAAPGVYSWLPLGKIVLENVARVVREEMDAMGGQELLLPALLPKEYYEATGRWEEYGDTLFRLKDRKGADYLLGPTHEELFTLLVKGEYSSYKDFPVVLYQIQEKFRDEARPRAGVLRGREFHMKDSYSFDIDDAGLQESYDKHRAAYIRIFDRLGAGPAALHLRRQMREAGAAGVSRGPRPSTRQNELGLTPRQAQVADLLAEGASNPAIARRLGISAKTVEHHVSAVLAKLDAGSRDEAARIVGARR